MSSSITSQFTVPQPENYWYVESVNLNEAMQQVLHQFQNQKNAKLIVRSENLPAIEANKTNVVKVLDNVLNMIATHPPAGSPLFLYIDCEEENKGKTDPVLTKGYKRYNIRFHTNVHTNNVWKINHQRTIDECTAILKQYGASFTVNEIKSTGCLFRISLLGKM